MGKDRVLRLFNAFFRGKILIFGHFTGQLLVWDISKKRPWALKRWVTLLSWKKWYFGVNMGWIRVVRLFHDILKKNNFFCILKHSNRIKVTIFIIFLTFTHMEHPSPAVTYPHSRDDHFLSYTCHLWLLPWNNLALEHLTQSPWVFATLTWFYRKNPRNTRVKDQKYDKIQFARSVRAEPQPKWTK